MPLFTGGKLSRTYGGGFIEVPLPELPSMSRRATIVAIISGHGQEEGHDCAEFCETNHVFRVGGGGDRSSPDFRYFRNFTAALGFPGGSEHADDGCTLVVGSVGVQPNQFGTWEFARGGWCNANPVKQWVFDVTEEVAIARTGWAATDVDVDVEAETEAAEAVEAAVGADERRKKSERRGRPSISIEYFAALKGRSGMPALGKVAEGAGGPAFIMESYLVFSS